AAGNGTDTVLYAYGQGQRRGTRTGMGSRTFAMTRNGDDYTGIYDEDIKTDLNYSFLGVGQDDTGYDRDTQNGTQRNVNGVDVGGPYTELGTTDESVSFSHSGNDFTGAFSGDRTHSISTYTTQIGT